MKKYIKIVPILFLIPLILLSCGFKPINQKNNAVIDIQNLNVIGEQRITYLLKNGILLISNKNSENKYNGVIKIQKSKKSKIKDKTGKVKRYNITLTANLELKDLKGNKNLEKTFKKNGDYEVVSIHSDTVDNENNAIKAIIQKISDDMISFITIAVRN